MKHDKQDIKELVKCAKEGDRDALESLVKLISDRIYRFALKMLYQTTDAEDATQEILIKIITKLDSFREESTFSTWALTIAANHIKNRRANQKERWYTFERCEDAILKEIPDQSTLNHPKAEQELIVEEMRISCMHALLQCLDRDHRMVYILGVAMGMSGPEGAEILEISPAAFRKRLSRARESLRNFFVVNCDLFDRKNPCNCRNQAVSAIKRGIVKTSELRFAGRSLSKKVVLDVEKHLVSLDHMAREVALMKINQDYKAPELFIQGIRQVLEAGLN